MIELKCLNLILSNSGNNEGLTINIIMVCVRIGNYFAQIISKQPINEETFSCWFLIYVSSSLLIFRYELTAVE